MLGLTYGQADDALDLLVTSQAVLGRGYDLLRQAACRRPALGWPRPVVRECTDNAVLVDLAGSPLLTLGTRLADLAASTASGRAEGWVLATGVFGLWAAPLVVRRIARAGGAGLAIWRPPEADEGEPSPGLAACIGDSQGLVAVAPCDTFGVDRLPRRVPLRACPKPPPGLVEAWTRATSGALLLCFSQTAGEADALGLAGGYAAEMRSRRLQANLGLLDVAGRLEAAVRDGLTVAEEDHRVLTALAARIRIPTSERSRSQAG